VALKRPRLDEGRRRRSLSSATAVVPLDQASSWKTWKFGNRDWQIEAWRLYDIVPEHRFLSNWIGDSVAQARLFVTEVAETGEETGEVADSRIARLAAVPLGTGTHRDDNLRLAGVDLAVGGECWIVGEGAAESPEDAEGSWFVVTGAAFKRQGNDVIVRRPKTRGGDELKLRDGTDILARCWRPHPNDVDQADSPTRAAIVPLREIELLTKREFAELDSRLTGAGVWFLPEGIDFPRGEDDPEGLAGFMAYLQRAAATSMRSQGQASSVVPMMATIPDQMIEHLDKIRPITFWSELSSEISPMKEKAIGRVASAFEIPNEILIGMATANHWPCDEATEIYTRDGWITYQGLEAGVEVLALDIESGTSCFQAISGARVEHVVDRPMISLESQLHSSLTTPDHRWPVERDGRLEWARTEDFLDNPDHGGQSRRRRSMLLGATYQDLPAEPKFSDAFVQLLAWCATDADLTPPNRGYQLRIRQRNAENFPSIQAAVRDVDHAHYTDHSAGVNEWMLSKTATAAMDAYGVRIGTRWFLSRDTVSLLTQAQLHLLLETALRANGNRRTLFSVDESRLDAFEHAAILLGHRVSRGRRNQQTGWGNLPVAWLSWGPSTRFAPRPGAHIEHVSYTGVIFCPKVPVGQSFLARRNGKVFFTGNTAWAISEEGIKRIKSYLGYIADALTRSFLRPALERMGITSPERYAFAFDTSPLAARPNRMDEALQLHDRLLLSDEEAVKAGAFDPAQMPTTQERVKMLALKLVQSRPELLADPAIQGLLGFPVIGRVAATGAAPALNPAPDDDDEPADGPPDNLDDGPSEDDPDPGSARAITAALGNRAARAIEARLNDRIAEIAMTARPTPPPDPAHVFNAASKLIVLRALELAGGRLTTPAERRGRWAEVPRHELHVRVGPVTPDKAVKVTIGAWDHLPEVARDLGVDAEDLGRLLRGYVFELLTRGMAHHDDLLYAALSIANRGQGLEPEPVGVPA